MRNYNVNYETKEIIITKAFANKAAALNTPEAAIMKQLRTEYPDFTFAYKKIKENKDKESYNGLSLETMNVFFLDRIKNEKKANSEEKAELSSKEEITSEEKEKLASEKDYEEFKKVAEVFGKKKYATIKKWFLDRFKEEYKVWYKDNYNDELKKWATANECKAA